MNTSAPVNATTISKRRREFLSTLLGAFVVLGAAIAGLIPPLRRWLNRLRPPGALPQQEFLSACIKCGQCVQVCPVQALRLADIGDGAGNGAPYIEPRLQACDFSCDVLQCVLACPTGALRLEPQEKERVRMGRAVFVRPELCLARQGKGLHGPARPAGFSGVLRYAEIDRWRPQPVASYRYDLETCDLCVRQCPIPGAIRMRQLESEAGTKRAEPEVLDKCVGCGVCEMICPAEPSCIEVRLSHPQEAGIT